MWCHRAAGVDGCQIEACLLLVVGIGWNSVFRQDLLMLRRPYFNLHHCFCPLPPIGFPFFLLGFSGPWLICRCRKNRLPTVKGQNKVHSVTSIQKAPWLLWDEESTHSEICERNVDPLFSVSRQRSPKTTECWRCARQPVPADAVHDPNQCRSCTVAPCDENSWYYVEHVISITHRRSTDVLASLQVPWVQRHKGPVAPAA